jgi:hypothetical protein
MKLGATPHSLSPFPLARGRGNGYIREAKPLFDSPLVSLSLIRRGGFIIEEGLTPLLDIPTLPTQSKKRQTFRYVYREF